MPMKNPPHPGKIVRAACLEPLGLSVTEAAKVLGVSRQALSNLVNGHARMSADMAIRLAKAFGSSTETWIRLQTAYDIARAHEREGQIAIRGYEPQTDMTPRSPPLSSSNATCSSKQVGLATRNPTPSGLMDPCWIILCQLSIH